MRELPPGVLELLKSRSMIGANKPAYKVSIEGQILGFNWETGNVWRRPQSGTITEISIAKKANGALIFVSISTGEVYEGEVSDVNTLLGANDTVIGWVGTGITTNVYGRSAVFWADRDLWLSVAQAGSASVEAWYKLYKSPSGNGGDWTLYSIVYSAITANSDFIRVGTATAGTITVLDNGRYVLCGPWYHTYEGCRVQAPAVWTSDNNGVTWTRRMRGIWYMMGGYYFHKSSSRHVVRSGSGTLYFAHDYDAGSAGTRVWRSIDNGTSWNTAYYYDSGFTNVAPELMESADGGIYLFTSNFKISSNPNYVYYIPDPDNSSDRELLKTTTIIVNGTRNYVTQIDGKLIWCSSTSVLGLDTVSESLTVKSITTSRNRGMAAGLTVVLDNIGGRYSPDHPANDWAGILRPNKTILVEQGYGAKLVKTFTGMVDRVDVRTFPQELALASRDTYKRALDQTITHPVLGGRNVSFAYSTPESIVTTLAGWAGITIGTAEVTGITLTEKIFSWESYGDAFSWLAELVGFEIGVDEDGDLYYRKDYQPALPTISYEFKEGEDIISLGYTIDDRELAHSIIVHGKDANDNVIEVVIPFGAPLTYGLNKIDQKVLKIDAPEADTTEQLTAIGNRAHTLMLSRARVVDFACIAVPWLQVGDFIRVIESSVGISEVYRITDISTTQDKNGYISQLRCYWYGGVS